MSDQLEMFGPAPREQQDEEWCTGCTPYHRCTCCEWDPMLKYLHLVRAPGDPDEKRARGRGTTIAGLPSATAWKTLLRATPENVTRFREAVIRGLVDGQARTFNALTIEACGYTADACGGKAPDRALWELAGEGLIEHSLASPVLWRITTRGREWAAANGL